MVINMTIATKNIVKVVNKKEIVKVVNKKEMIILKQKYAPVNELYEKMKNGPKHKGYVSEEFFRGLKMKRYKDLCEMYWKQMIDLCDTDQEKIALSFDISTYQVGDEYQLAILQIEQEVDTKTLELAVFIKEKYNDLYN